MEDHPIICFMRYCIFPFYYFHRLFIYIHHHRLQWFDIKYSICHCCVMSKGIFISYYVFISMLLWSGAPWTDLLRSRSEFQGEDHQGMGHHAAEGPGYYPNNAGGWQCYINTLKKLDNIVPTTFSNSLSSKITQFHCSTSEVFSWG